MLDHSFSNMDVVSPFTGELREALNAPIYFHGPFLVAATS